MMRRNFPGRSFVQIATASVGAVVAVVIAVMSWTHTSAQAPAAGAFPRTSWDRKPDLNGIWQTMNTANWDLEDHGGGPASVMVTGAVGARPPGLSVVEGGRIPYRPEALAKREENRRNSMPGKMGRVLSADPEVNCFLPGVPRATYLPYPFQILQSPNRLWMVYQYSYARREIHMNGKGEAPLDSWMGWSNGRWEGDTLVVDSTGFNDQSWFDRAGNYHSEALHVVERYSPIDATHIDYEATVEDPNTFTRPWKIRMPLYKHIAKDAQILEFKCAEYVQRFFWGEYEKKN